MLLRASDFYAISFDLAHPRGGFCKFELQLRGMCPSGLHHATPGRDELMSGVYLESQMSKPTLIH